MSHPSEFYIRYLIAHGLGTNEEENHESVLETLEALRLPPITPPDFDRLVADCAPSHSISWHNPRHEPTIRWTKDIGIFSMWQAGEDEIKALELHTLPQVKEVIQILLMGRIQPKDIAIRIHRRFGKEYGPDAVAAFSHYFWNVERASIQEWFTHLNDFAMRDHYMAALVCSPNQALYRAGFSPVIDGAKVLKDVHRQLAMRIEAIKMFPDSKDTSDMLTKYSRELRDVHSMLFGEGSQMEESIKELKKFMLQRNAPKVPALRLVAQNGSFTSDGKDND